MTPSRFDPDRLVEEYRDLPLRVARVMHRIVPSHVRLDDMEADGNLGLLKASRSFDPSRGIPFESWAGLRIRGAILDGMRDRDFSFRADRRRGTAPEFESLSSEVRGRGDSTTPLGDLIEDPRLDVEATVEARERIAEVLALPERERIALVGVGVEATEPLGVSEGRVSQLRSRARARLNGEIVPRTRPSSSTCLSPSESAVLALAAEGCTVAETADRLAKGVETVKSQRKAAIRKLGAREITNAVFVFCERFGVDSLKAAA